MWGLAVMVVTLLPLQLAYWLEPALFTNALGLKSRYNWDAGAIEPRSWWTLFVHSLPLAATVAAMSLFPRLGVKPAAPAHTAVRTRVIGVVLAAALGVTLVGSVLWDFVHLGVGEGKFARWSAIGSFGLSAFYLGTYTGVPLAAAFIPLPRLVTFISSLDAATENGVDIHVAMGHLLTFTATLHAVFYMAFYSAIGEAYKLSSFRASG